MKNYIPNLAQILISIYLICLSTALYAENEPNNTYNDANSLQLNQETNGSLASDDIIDFYKIDIAEDGRLSVRDSSDGSLQYNVTLLDSDGTTSIRSVLRFSDNSGWRIDVNLSPGTYYLKFDKYGAGPDGSYTLNAQFVKSTYPGDNEPNDLSEYAQHLNLNQMNSGNLGNRRDGSYDQTDWWKFTIVEDGRLEIKDTTEAPLQYYMYLYDEDGTTEIKNVLRFNDNSGTRLAISLSPGIYFLRLDLYGEVYNTYGSYTIEPDFTPTTYPGDPEPNDSLSTASVLSVGSRQSGNLGSRRQGDYDDIDWWKIELQEDGLLTVLDSTQSPLQYYISLYEEDGITRVDQKIRFYDNSGTRINSKLNAGIYYLVLEKYGDDYYTYGSYTLDLKLLPKPLANFNLSRNINSIVLSNLSENASIYKWDFDDGNTSDKVNPSHTFDVPGDFLISLIATNDFGNDTSSALVSIYGIKEIKPQKGGNMGEVTISIIGGGLSKDAVIKLHNDNYSDMEANSVFFYERGVIRATFNLDNAELDTYDVVVENPGKDPIIKEEAFTVVQADQPMPWVNLSGRSKALLNRWQTYTIFFGNTGNVDADLVPVWITISDPTLNQIQIMDLDILYPDYVEDNNLNYKLDSVNFYFDIDTLWGTYEPTRVFPLYIPKIPAGYSGSLSFKIKTNTEVRINVWNNDPLMENGQLKSFCLEENPLLGLCIEEAKKRALRDLALTYIGLIPGGACITSVTKEFFAIRDMRMQNFTQRRSWGSFAYAMTGLFLGCVGDLVPISKVYDLAIAVTGTIQFLHDGIYAAHMECQKKFGVKSHKKIDVQGVTSYDPNEIVGPLGYGPENCIASVNTVDYTIYFENKSTAGAPAQEIWIKDTLDTDKYDLDEFTFQSVSLGDSLVISLYGQKEFALDVDLRPAQEILGRIIGSLDTTTGVINVYFSSLNPVTMGANEDPTLGILPPNINPYEGEGSVSYTVGLKNPLNGKVFSNSATIIFDFNDPILTNTWTNKIDTIAPESKIETFNYDPLSGECMLTISGDDNLSGIEFYTVYVSRNDSSFVPVLRTSENTVSYNINENLSYRFYSVATDSTGHIEAAPMQEDIALDLTGVKEFASNKYKVFPVPASDKLFVQSANSGVKKLQIFTVEGKTIYSEIRTENLIQINTSEIEKGLYILKISDSNSSVVKKVIIN